MVASSAGQIIQEYFRAFHSGDANAARQLLADDLQLEGPFEKFDNADDYLQAVAKLGPIVKDVDMKKMWADDNDACVIYDMITDTPIGTAPIVEWHSVRGGKIAEIRVYFDPDPS